MKSEEQESGPEQEDSYPRPSVAEAFLAILTGLTAVTALDQLFAPIRHFNNPRSIWNFISSDPSRHIFLVFQATIFFLTALRFYLGSLRYHQHRATHYKKLALLIYDVLFVVILFSGFYVSAQALRSTTNFYLFMAILHGVDFLWFAIALQIVPMPNSYRVALKRFLLYDLVTLSGFGFALTVRCVFHLDFGAPYIFQYLCLAVLFIVGIIDLKQNSSMYLGRQVK